MELGWNPIRELLCNIAGAFGRDWMKLRGLFAYLLFNRRIIGLAEQSRHGAYHRRDLYWCHGECPIDKAERVVG